MQHDVTIVSTDCRLPGTERWLLEKDGGATPPAGTQSSCFECSLLEPNSAQTDAGTGGLHNHSPYPRSKIAKGFSRGVYMYWSLGEL